MGLNLSDMRRLYHLPEKGMELLLCECAGRESRRMYMSCRCMGWDEDD